MDFYIPLGTVIYKTEWGMSWVNPLLGFLGHAFFDFFFQIIRIVLGHQQPDAVYEFSLRPGVLRKDFAFFYKMNI